MNASVTLSSEVPVSRGWFSGGLEKTKGRLALICFPYAGGTPSIFGEWQQYFGEKVSVLPALLPGRGPRFRESPYDHILPLATQIAETLIDAEVDRGPFAFFGHSMGALLAYEVACHLRQRRGTAPKHLFVSASRAPHFHGKQQNYLLPNDELHSLVKELGGLGVDEVVGRAYLERRMPILRADLRVCEAYEWEPRRPLQCPITAFCAAHDPIATSSEMDGWKRYTARSFVMRRTPGNHFYLQGQEKPQLLALIQRELNFGAGDHRQ